MHLIHIEAGTCHVKSCSIVDCQVCEYAGPPPAGFPGDLPQPEPLSASDAKDASDLSGVLQEYLIRCLFSKNWQLREAALQHIGQQLSGQVGPMRAHNPAFLQRPQLPMHCPKNLPDLKGYSNMMQHGMPDAVVHFFVNKCAAITADNGAGIEEGSGKVDVAHAAADVDGQGPGGLHGWREPDQDNRRRGGPCFPRLRCPCR